MGKYTPLARLGNGGMADVFLAVARGPMGFNKLTVVKRLRNSEENTHVQMFLDEARLAARLNHPNIVHTYEVGEVGGRFFIAMEYLEGQSLHQVIARLNERQSGLDEATIALIASHALKGLHHAHELCDFDGSPIGVVHRDVSPHNLFITYTGEIKLLDFGIAKATVNSTHTDTGVLKGKVRYMAPEQVTGKPVDRRLDIFAFGVVLWEMLARRPLFQGDAVTILTRIATEPIPSVRSIRPEVSADLDAIVLRALRHEPGERYQSADAMRADIDQYLRTHDGGALERDLGRMMNEFFAETREGVRTRIKAFLANVQNIASEEAQSMPGLTHSGELPALLNDSNPNAAPPVSGMNVAGSHYAHLTASGRLQSTLIESGQRRAAWPIMAVGAVLIAALVAGILALRHPAPAAVAMPPMMPTTARMHLETTPPGALIEWNGRPLDRTPADLTLEPGPQTLVVSRDGYETEMFSVDVKAGDTVTRTLELRSKPAPATSAGAAAGAAHALPMAPQRSWAPARQSPAPAPAPSAAPASAPSATPPPTATARPKIKILDDTEAP
jgi:eukaryotic-like serine/threonine-protein kinase